MSGIQPHSHIIHIFLKYFSLWTPVNTSNESHLSIFYNMFRRDNFIKKIIYLKNLKLFLNKKNTYLDKRI